MKKIVLAFLIGLIFIFCDNNLGIENTENQSISKSVLFVGNSLTFYNNLPQQVDDMANSVNSDLVFETHLVPGSKVVHHANSDELEEKINSRNWDYMTIQTQSLESALSQEHFDENVYPHVLTLIDKMKSNFETTDALFFMTWGYKNGEFPPCPLPYLCEFEGMHEKVRERYTFMAQSTNSVLSPVGNVWKKIIDLHPEIELYNPDESHPSANGTFLAACTFFTIIFKKDPTLIQYNNPEVDDAIEAVIKNQVKQTVYNNLNSWYYN